jgi:uncharacterized peroxidase-related enzyme
MWPPGFEMNIYDLEENSMARVRDVEIDEVPENARETYSRFANEYGPFINQVKVMANRPVALRHIMGMLLELKEEGVLPKRYLEIALVVVSKLNECTYCVAHHTPRLIEQGLSVDAVENILADKIEGFDQVDMLVRDYAVQVTEKPQYMRDRIFEDLRKHFNDEQIVELTLRTALCGFFNRFNDALQIGMEDGVVADMLAHGASEKSLPQHAAE